LAIELVVNATRIGTTAAAAPSFPAATSDDTEIAAEWVSANPPTAAASVAPDSPKMLRAMVEPTMIAETRAPNASAERNSKGLPTGKSLRWMLPLASAARTAP
jgi:hypothetical protein